MIMHYTNDPFAQKSGPLHLTTPGGNEIQGEWDRNDLALRHAKVVNHYTGVIHPLDQKTSEALARALKAKEVYEDVLAETREVETTLKRFSSLKYVLGEDHPTLEPYKKEVEQQKTLARDMFVRARQYHDDAMEAIDRLAKQELE